MFTVTTDEKKGIVIIEPNGPLAKQDFESAVKTIDPFIEKHNHLNGLVIHTQLFPGWDSFAALSSHFQFIRDHHKKISRIAFVTDSVIKNFAEKVGSHFVNAEIKAFSYQDLEKAIDWAATSRVP
jgi:hypothetical protein